MCCDADSYSRRKSFLFYLVLRKDNVECLQRLFKYPSVDDPITLIKIALNIKGKS